MPLRIPSNQVYTRVDIIYPQPHHALHAPQLNFTNLFRLKRACANPGLTRATWAPTLIRNGTHFLNFAQGVQGDSHSHCLADAVD